MYHYFFFLFLFQCIWFTWWATVVSLWAEPRPWPMLDKSQFQTAPKNLPPNSAGKRWASEQQWLYLCESRFKEEKNCCATMLEKEVGKYERKQSCRCQGQCRRRAGHAPSAEQKFLAACWKAMKWPCSPWGTTQSTCSCAAHGGAGGCDLKALGRSCSHCKGAPGGAGRLGDLLPLETHNEAVSEGHIESVWEE